MTAHTAKRSRPQPTERNYQRFGHVAMQCPCCGAKIGAFRHIIALPEKNTYCRRCRKPLVIVFRHERTAIRALIGLASLHLVVLAILAYLGIGPFEPGRVWLMPTCIALIGVAFWGVFSIELRPRDP